MSRPRKIDHKTSFMMDRTWRSSLMQLNDSQLAQWTRACFSFVSGLKPEITDPMVKLMFGVFSDFYVVNEARYRETCDRNREIAILREARRREERENQEAMRVFESQGDD